MGKSRKHLYAPPGMPLWRERLTFWLLLMIAVTNSLRFFSALEEELQHLHARLAQYELMGVSMSVKARDLYQLLEGKFLPFGVVILLCLIAIGTRYYYYQQDSKSIYLMRRLPDPREWHRSCLVQPLLRILLVLVIMAVLLGIFYGVYMARVPEQCLEPYQWQKLWR